MSPDGQVMTLLVSEHGPFESLANLADGCRELVREEFIQAAHPGARERLGRLDWSGVYIESTLQMWRIPAPVPRRVLTCSKFDKEVAAISAEDRVAVMAMAGRGLTASGHPMDLTDAANNLIHALWALERGEVLESEDPGAWRPCLTEDLEQLGLWNSEDARVRWLATLWPFPA